MVVRSLGKYCLIGLIVGASLQGCSNSRGTRGYLFDPALANSIYPGVDNRISVQDTLGSPTVPSIFNPNVWYYVSTEVRTRPVFWPDPKKHRVMAVYFADNGMVENIVNYDLNDTRTIYPVRDKTPTRGTELSFFQQLFTNIGQVGSGPQQGRNNRNRGPGPNG